MRFAHARFVTACFISMLLSAWSLLSAGYDSDALLLVEVTIPVLLVAFVSVALVEKRQGGGG